MTIAYAISNRSPDQTTKVGSVVVKDNDLLSVGYNGLPRGIEDAGPVMEDGHPQRLSRINGEKYNWVSHAEANAILHGARNGKRLGGSTLYVTMVPCVECARSIIGAGISCTVIHLQGAIAQYWGYQKVLSLETNPALQMLTEAGIDLVWYTGAPWNMIINGERWYADQTTVFRPEKKQFFDFGFMHPNSPEEEILSIRNKPPLDPAKESQMIPERTSLSGFHSMTSYGDISGFHSMTSYGDISELPQNDALTGDIVT